MCIRDRAQTLIRHWVYDSLEEMRWDLVATSSVSALAEVAVRASRAESYHRMHADALLDKLLVNPEARGRLLPALDIVLDLVPSLLAPPPGEAEAIAAGVQSGSLADLGQPLQARIAERFNVSPDPLIAAGIDERRHRSEHFGPLMARMREVFEFDPEAVW